MIEDVLLVGRCPCGSLRINKVWYEGGVEYINFVNAVKYSDSVCSEDCTVKYYGVSSLLAEEMFKEVKE